MSRRLPGEISFVEPLAEAEVETTTKDLRTAHGLRRSNQIPLGVLMQDHLFLHDDTCRHNELSRFYILVKRGIFSTYYQSDTPNEIIFPILGLNRLANAEISPHLG